MCFFVVMWSLTCLKCSIYVARLYNRIKDVSDFEFCKSGILPFNCRATLCYGVVYAVVVCPSVHLSVCQKPILYQNG